jgi:hypothetical protein
MRQAHSLPDASLECDKHIPYLDPLLECDKHIPYLDPLLECGKHIPYLDASPLAGNMFFTAIFKLNVRDPCFGEKLRHTLPNKRAE